MQYGPTVPMYKLQENAHNSSEILNTEADLLSTLNCHDLIDAFFEEKSR
jgi:hypothetical protein